MNNSDSLKDEIFCLKYELEAISGHVMGGIPERWIEGYTTRQTHNEHVQRYHFASRFTKGRKVLDLACGSGRGSRILAETGGASHVTACDIDERAIRYAAIKNRHPNVCFQACDGLQLNHREEFDVVVCFETIEHIPTPDKFIQRLASALKKEGLLLISTPVSTHDMDLKPMNPYHLREWGEIAFRRFVEKEFTVRKIHLQYSPVWKPALWKRLLTKIRERAATRPDPGEVMPHWDEFNADKLSHALPSGAAASYQILECLRR